MAEEIAETTLRDTIEAAFDEHVEPVEKPAPVSDAAPAVPETPKPEGERARDEQGRFVKADEKPEAKAVPGPKPSPDAGSAAAVPPLPQGHGLARPSSWKKDYEEKWRKLDADLAKYVIEREKQFADGVSTYKREFDNLKPIAEAITPFIPHLQQAGIHPGQWISNLGNAHMTLVRGSPEQKLGMFLKLAQDYQVPLQALFQQGQDGKVYFNPQVQPYQPAQHGQQPNIEQLIEQKLIQKEAVQALARFEQEASTKYPHYETVKEEMARLLEAGLAPDYPSAYERAVRMNDALWTSVQEEKRKADEAERQRQSQEAALRARRNAVSTRSATPAGKPAKEGKRSLRDELSEAWDTHVEAGRV